MTTFAPAPPARTPALRSPVSAGHAATLSTTSGITSVITGVMAAAFAAQAPPLATASPAGALAAATVGALAVGAAGLYESRHAIGQALDLAAGDPPRAATYGARALAAYHAGMVGVFTGLATGAAWKVALPHGAIGWVATAVAAGLAVVAAVRALGWAAEWTRRRDGGT